MENLIGNRFSATQDWCGNWEILDRTTGKSVYLQGDDAVDFEDNHKILEALEYPQGPFKTFEQYIDACLDQYESVMEPMRHTDKV